MTMELPLGYVVGDYAVEALIARGGPWRWYRVRHVDLSSLHCLSLVTKATGELCDGLLAAGRFQAMLRHPNIASATDTVRLEEDLGLVLDWMVGPTLCQHVMALGPIAIEDADGLAAGLLAALDCTHQHGLVHRDVAPNNVMLRQTDGEAVPVLMDFAQAKQFGFRTDNSTQQLAVGLPGFTAPEQAVDARLADVRADVFGAAATLYYALSGRAPFPGDAHAALAAARTGVFAPLDEIRPEIPARMARAVRAAMTKEPAARLPDARAVLRMWMEGANSQPRFRAPLGPTGDVALVFTDVQGSTQMWEQAPETMRQILIAHDTVMRSYLARLGGFEVKTQGDSFMVAFPNPMAAIRWCMEVQVVLDGHPWPPSLSGLAGSSGGKLLVRMGIHVGEPECKPHLITGAMDYFGPVVNCAARISGAAHGGQILASPDVVRRVRDGIREARITSLGTFLLKGIAHPTELWEIVPEAIERAFPPPNAQRATS
jgi:class 3 adenylate cyclase